MEEIENKLNKLQSKMDALELRLMRKLMNGNEKELPTPCSY